MIEKNPKFTVTIGIPAYNEEKNIGHLIDELLIQTQESFSLEKIYVYSDGSTDGTNKIVNFFENDAVELIEGVTRGGQAFGQNYIFKEAKSDCVVLINADIKIVNKFFLEKLIGPITKNQADLTSSSLIPLSPRSFFEKTMVAGMSLKNMLFESYKDGNNYYTCHGAARAFGRKLYPKLRFPQSIGEDAYSFLYCVYHKGTYKYVKEAVAYYRLVNNFSDHIKQSTRFFQGRNSFADEFGSEFIQRHNRIPLKNYLITMLRSLKFEIKNSAYLACYLLTVTTTRIISLFIKNAKDAWSISKSSKDIR